MIVIPIKGPGFLEAQQQLKAAQVYADVIEIPVDLMPLNLKELDVLKQSSEKPVLFRLRSQRQGGAYAGTQEEQLELLKSLAQLQPTYLDVEYNLLPFTKREFPLAQQLIVSFHDWNGVPAELDLLLQRMKQCPAVLYKIAVMPKELSELTRFLDFLSQTNGEVLGVAMGELGVISRQAAKRFGSWGTFACLNDSLKTAPGQIPPEILLERYAFGTQSRKTELYGLLGDPVSRSVSDRTHNYLLRQKGADALYLKIHTPRDQLEGCMDWVRKQNFRGLSVTMPLKEAVVPFLDQLTPLAEAIGAVNTLFWQDGKLVGDNTDAYGAVMALKEQCVTLKGKRLVILGVGGAAKALAFAAVQEGAELVCVGRDREKSAHFASYFGGRGIAFEELPIVAREGYDILVNATPVKFPIAEADLLPDAVLMTMQTAGEQFKQPIIPGFRMFVHQAVEQWKRWKPEWDRREVQELLEAGYLIPIEK